MLTISKVFVEFVTILLLSNVSVLEFFFSCEACGILTSWSGIYLTPAALGGEAFSWGGRGEALNTRLPGKSPANFGGRNSDMIWYDMIWYMIKKMLHDIDSAVATFSVHFSCSFMSDSLQPMHCSTPGPPVHHQLPELAQTHVHRVSDAIQPSHPLLSPSPPTFNLSHHEGLFQWVSSLHQVARVLEFQLQHQFFQWIFRTDFP